MAELIARRQFSPLYIWLDIVFLVAYLGLLLWKKKYMTVLVGLVMGAVYLLVDYGIFHLVCHSRSITEGYSLFWVLLWMSMSYGFTNFTWIWLALSKDGHLLEWSLLILGWWFCCPLLTQTFAPDAAVIVIQRTTGAYHGYMAAILFAGYLGAICYNLRQTAPEKRMHLAWLLAIGVETGQMMTMDDLDPDAYRKAMASRDDRHWVYHRAGLPCRVCGTEIVVEEAAGRKLYWCPNCQR